MSDGGRDLGRDEIIQLLREVGDRLDEKGLTASIYVVGGTAMALTLNSRRVTRDVDAALQDHPDELREATDQVAEAHGLGRDWFNPAAIAFTTNEADVDAGELTVPGLDVSIISPKHLLAMKIRANRGKDFEDLVYLFHFLGIDDPQQAADITNELFDDTYVGWFDPDEALYIAEDVFRSAEARGLPIGSTRIDEQDLGLAAEAEGGRRMVGGRSELRPKSRRAPERQRGAAAMTAATPR